MEAGGGNYVLIVWTPGRLHCFLLYTEVFPFKNLLKIEVVGGNQGLTLWTPGGSHWRNSFGFFPENF